MKMLKLAGVLAAAGLMAGTAACAYDPYGAPGYGPGYGYRDRDGNPPGPAGGPGTNWENPPGPRGGPGASPDRYGFYPGQFYAGYGYWNTERACWYGDRDNNPPGRRGGPGTNWENPPGPRGGPGASPDRYGRCR
jgi:hypothetical protein